MNWLLKKICLYLPYKIISGGCHEQLGSLLIRYFIFRSKYIGVFIHRLLRSDVRTMHDHPWTFISIILTGEYTEHTLSKHINNLEVKKVYKRFSILYRPAKWIHRLEMDKPMWTLVIRFKRTKPWEFFSKTGFVNWKEYNYQGDCE